MTVSLKRKVSSSTAGRKAVAVCTTAQPVRVALGKGALLLACSLIAVAFNLRTVFSSLGAVLHDVQSSLGLTSAATSAITTLPVLCLGLFAPLAPGMARQFGPERAVFVLMAAISAGLLARGTGEVTGLIVGSVVAGSAIAIINVLLPGIIKRDFPTATGLMAGLYSMALLAGAATAAGATLPLERAFGGGWSTSLALWALPAAIASACWFFQLPKGLAHARKTTPRVRGLWRCPLAWQLTLFMVLQSMYSFTVFGWLGSFIAGRGIAPVTSSTIVCASILLQTLSCLAAPLIATRLANQSWFNVMVVSLATAGFLGCLVAPTQSVWLWAGVQGLGQGGLTSIAITMIVLRSENAHVAATLSAMVQSIGYGVGALGPLLVGLLYKPSASYVPVEVFFCVVGAGLLYFGYTAGRTRYVSARLDDVQAAATCPRTFCASDRGGK